MMVQPSILEIFADDNTTGVAFKNKALKRQLIQHLDIHGNATITDLTQALNISIPKTTNLVNELMEDGLIKDYGKIDSTGGRRASMYGLVAEAAYFVGIDIKRYFINFGLLDFKKNLIGERMQIPFTLENTKESYQQLIQLIKDFLAFAVDNKRTVLALGINLSGRINTNTGYSYSFFHFNEEPLSVMLQQELGIPAFIENDSRSMAMGEFAVGVVKEEQNVLFVNLDYGIGLGILTNGQVFYGKSGFSGEFGHIPIFNNEIICQCGKKGCLETEAAGWALLNMLRKKVEEGSSTILLKEGKTVDEIRLRDIVWGTQQDDTLCIELMAIIGERLGKGLATLINLFNPELVVLGGVLAETGDYLRLPVRSALNKYSLSLVNNDTQLKISKLGERAGVYGSCLVARSKLLDLPIS